MKLLAKIFLVFLLCVLLGRATTASGWIMIADRWSEGRVIAISASTYVTDFGVSRGAKEGSFYLVYVDGGYLHDAYGAFLGSYLIPIAVLKANGVSTSESYCEVVLPSKGWVIQRGDKVIPITASTAHNLKFATYRATPDRPHLPGYNGRWARISPPPASHSVIVNYSYPWTLQGLPQNVPPAAPGLYYMERPMTPPFNVDAIRVTAGPPTVAGPVYPVVPAPVPQPYYQPYSHNYPPYRTTSPGFDVNQTADSRLIRTFPLSEVEVYALEIQHRAAWDLYSNNRLAEALDAFSQQSVAYAGNYLSPYWAGRSALKLGDRQAAASWFDWALKINPNYQPAKNGLAEAAGNSNQGALNSGAARK
jgi:hypothetical protein